MEIWKDIPNFEGYYQVSNEGRVRSIDRTVSVTRCGNTFQSKLSGKILRQTKTKGGYLRIQLLKHGKYYTFNVHRLVAFAFLENPSNLPEVNHIDADKKNNNVENLEWCTRQHNIQHAFKHGLIDTDKRSQDRRKRVRRSDGQEFRSLTEAADASGTHVSDVSMCCHGKLAHTGGYGFEFV